MRNLRAFTQQIMGMPISLHVRAADADRPDIADAAAQVFAHLRKVDSVFSLYRPDSQLMRWRAGELSTARLHPWVEEVHELCEEARQQTDGLFTPWLPAADTGEELSDDTDVRVAFDPTGLVKGWAVAGATAYLHERHAIAYCLNAAGDMAIGAGRGLDAIAPWVVGIEDAAERGKIARTIEITTGAVATSGSAIRGDHFFDPRSKTWIASTGSATVVGPDLLWADVWATAASVDPEHAAHLLRVRADEYELVLL
ncbi:MAG: FAD:protein FMN transferase [Ornithinimicrobium sp.]